MYLNKNLFMHNMYILLLLVLFNTILNYKTIYYLRKLNILLVFPIKGRNGPVTLAISYLNTLKKLIKRNDINIMFNIIIKSNITIGYFVAYLSNKNNLIWFLYPDYIDYIYNETYTKLFKSVIYGPVVSPKKWFLFPMKNTYEAKWSSILGKIFAYVVQSDRVKRHLINRSQSYKSLEKKYIVSPGCLLVDTHYRILQWQERVIDILVYVKFADINKENELQLLIYYLNITYNIKVVRYGHHSQQSLILDAMNSKLLIYYSFYDIWPSALMEMANVGVLPIVQQCELMKKYGICIENFHLNLSRIMNFTKYLLSIKADSIKISAYYIKRNNCLNILKSTLSNIYFRKIKYN